LWIQLIFADITTFLASLVSAIPEVPEEQTTGAELTTDDVKEYLTWLAVKCHVAASTQNQAFNSLLFLFRHALKRDFGELRDVPRAKKSLYIPVVLSRGEIDAIGQHLYHSYGLIVKLLFGCGLRLFECLQLRVRDFNFDAGVLTVHGKGKKDRTVPLRESINDELQRQMKRVVDLHPLRAGTDHQGGEKPVGFVKGR
jgi:site-specific recombinase XerD